MHNRRIYRAARDLRCWLYLGECFLGLEHVGDLEVTCSAGMGRHAGGYMDVVVTAVVVVW